MELENLPEEISKLKKVSKEMIVQAVLNNYVIGNDEHVEAVKNAIIAQVEFFIEVDESLDIVGADSGFEISNFKVKGKIGPLAPRARRALTMEGLLFRGVNSFGGRKPCSKYQSF